jgi:phosphoglycerate kinase
MIKIITSVKIAGRRVIVRAGFDVPLKEARGGRADGGNWEVADDTRIRDILPTLNYLIEQKARIVIVSHLSRPEGWDENRSMWPVAEKLGEILNYKVVKISEKLPDYSVPCIYFLPEDITKGKYADLSKKLPPGSVLFLENIRFYPQEKGNDEKFAKLLASFADIYVNDAFSVAHRSEVSTVGLTRILPSYAGVSLAKEIVALNKLLKNPKHPMVLLLGGAKIADKVETLNHLAPHLDHILIGGAIATTFFKAMGYSVGKSKVSDVGPAKQLLRDYRSKILLPVDVVVATAPDEKPVLVKTDKVRASQAIYDIGPETIRKFAPIIKSAKTLVWNGPFGMIEEPKFTFGSKSIAHVFASRCKGKAYGVIGGGETIEVVNQAKVTEFIDHVSTGGGAMLEFLAGKKLPAIKALESK